MPLAKDCWLVTLSVGVPAKVTPLELLTTARGAVLTAAVLSSNCSVEFAAKFRLGVVKLAVPAPLFVARVAPAATAKPPDAVTGLTFNVPSFAVVVPVPPNVPVRASVPGPVLLSAPAPEKFPLKVRVVVELPTLMVPPPAFTPKVPARLAVAP